MPETKFCEKIPSFPTTRNEYESVPMLSAVTLHYPTVGGEMPLDLWRPDGPASLWKGLIIYAHGGGFSHGRRRDNCAEALAQRVTEEGYLLATIDYRLKGQPATMWTDAQKNKIEAEQQRTQRMGLRINPQYCGPWFYAAVEDFGAALAFLKSPSTGFDLTGLPVLAMGASAGGIAALSLLYSPAGWEHLPRPDAALGICAAMVQPWRLGVSKNVPAMLIHGPKDGVIPPNNARVLVRKAQEKGVALSAHFTNVDGHRQQVEEYLNGRDPEGVEWWRRSLNLLNKSQNSDQ